jgi:hypothetical protein
MFKDMLNVSPDKLGDILAGNSIEGSGILPCVEDFTNFDNSKNRRVYFKNKITIWIIIIAIVFIVFALYF